MAVVGTLTRRPSAAVSGSAGTSTAPAPVALAYASTVTPDATAGNYRIVTCTGDTTLAAPTNPVDGQMLKVRFVASGGTRTVTLDSALKLTTGQTTSLVVPSGKRGMVGLLYDSDDAAWTVLAVTAQQ
jgi:hypothetical protein